MPHMLQRHTPLLHLASTCLAALLLSITGSNAFSGELQRADIERRIQPPLRVGEKLREIPAWPITSELDTSGEPVGYVFESVDLAPIPGFEGTPIDLLVSIDRKGNFMDVEVIHQHEPVFLGGLGEEPLREFVRQYRDKSLRQDISVSTAYGGGKSEGNRVVLDGITKATASVRIVNQSVLGAALAVARAKLGFAGGQKKAVAAIRSDVSEQLSIAQLIDKGLIRRATLTNAQVEKLFAGTEGEGLDDQARSEPDGQFVDAYFACLNIPSVGRSLLG
ncbi:MAG TPA: FMN-binding protein, partial [Rhodocyclaceae bacterium]|nr:FMN-binding protein [Rhodocyclaceae bacterium]